MGPIRIAAIVLIIAGLLGLVYGGFTYTRETQEAKFGPFELTVKDKETVNVPVWAGVLAVAAGAGLLFFCRQTAIALCSVGRTGRFRPASGAQRHVSVGPLALRKSLP